MSEPQYGLGFPVPLSEKYRPARIADFAGLSEPKKILAGFVRNPSNCGFLFVGPAGTGKTSMGIALAGELQAFIHHVPAQECTVEMVRKLAFDCNYYPPMGYKRHLILIDEADLMSGPAQNAILSKLDGTEPVPDTVWVFTCNGTDRLAERFLSRNKVLNFSTYGIQADAAQLLESVWNHEAPQAEKPNFARIIKDATGNVRSALMTLEMKMLAV
jgi:replication-associated recombination protein RarA